MTMQAQATVKTEKAGRYMKALVNHFSSKVDAAYSANTGYVELGFGRCDIAASESNLTFQLTTNTADDLTHLKRFIGNHLTRFSQNEIDNLTWA